MKDKEQLEALLRSFFLSSFVRNYDDFAKRAEKEKLGYISYLHQLALTESSERQARRTERLINQAKLPRGKTLDGFDLTHQPTLSLARLKELAEGDCPDAKRFVQEHSSALSFFTTIWFGSGRF
jgi:DNA replication protein DnaC